MLLAGLALAWSSQPSSPAEAAGFTDRYDRTIKEAAGRWWPRHVHWLWWKAQLYQESRLDPEAESPVGAQGLAQFMPATWREVSTALDLGAYGPKAARPAIFAGAYYMRRQAAGWSSPRPEMDRWDLARASYNGGFGNLLKAQRLCDGATLYSEIAPCLVRVTGRHSEETLTYVERIHRWYKEMRSCRYC